MCMKGGQLYGRPYQIIKRKAMRLPLQPGVYIMKDKSDHVIYVGKAKALKIESVNILVRRKSR
ncbi:MAG: hypothetical protein ACLRX7_00515 [Acutalibacteraceae bacterium]